MNDQLLSTRRTITWQLSISARTRRVLLCRYLHRDLQGCFGRSFIYRPAFSGFSPKRFLFRGLSERFQERFGKDYYTTVVDEWAFVADSASEKLCSHFGVKTLKGFGLEDNPLALTAAGAILYYLELTRHEGLSHISSISRIDRDDYVWIDRFTFRNLSFQPLPPGRQISC